MYTEQNHDAQTIDWIREGVRGLASTLNKLHDSPYLHDFWMKWWALCLLTTHTPRVTDVPDPKWQFGLFEGEPRDDRDRSEDRLRDSLYSPRTTAGYLLASSFVCMFHIR